MLGSPTPKKGLLTGANLFISLDSLKPREKSLSFNCLHSLDQVCRYFSSITDYLLCTRHTRAHTPRDADVNWRLIQFVAFVLCSAVLIHYFKSMPCTCLLMKPPSQGWRRERDSLLGIWMKASCWQQARIPQCSWLAAITEMSSYYNLIWISSISALKSRLKNKADGLKKKKKYFLYLNLSWGLFFNHSVNHDHHSLIFE